MKKFMAKIAIAAMLMTQLAAPALAADCGCSSPLTQGYWKNHTSAWVDDLQDQTYYYKGQFYTWEEILKTPPKGDPWYILAHQYITFGLNINNGAYDYWEYEDLITHAQKLLWNDLGYIPKAQRNEATQLADTLAELNEAGEH